jgi:hypothetical protein
MACRTYRCMYSGPLSWWWRLVFCGRCRLVAPKTHTFVGVQNPVRRLAKPTGVFWVLLPDLLVMASWKPCAVSPVLQQKSCCGSQNTHVWIVRLFAMASRTHKCVCWGTSAGDAPLSCVAAIAVHADPRTHMCGTMASCLMVSRTHTYGSMHMEPLHCVLCRVFCALGLHNPQVLHCACVIHCCRPLLEVFVITIDSSAWTAQVYRASSLLPAGMIEPQQCTRHCCPA